MKKTKNTVQFTLVALSVLFLQACASMSYVRVTDQVIPAKYSLNETYKTALVMDRSIEKGVVKTAIRLLDKDQIFGIKTTNVGGDLIRSVASSLPQPINGGISNYRDKAGSEHGPAPQLKLAEITEFAKGSDILVTLDRLMAVEFRTYDNITKNQLDPQGKTYTINAVRGYKESHLINYWRIYDASTGVVLYEIDDTTKQGETIEALTTDAAIAHFDTSRVVNINTLKKACVENLKNDLNPQYIQSAWMYYKKGNEDLKLSGKFIKASDYTSSINLLEKSMKEYTKAKEKARAFYNIAVCYNLNGDITKALEWAQKGYDQTEDRMLRNLLGQLQEAERKKEKTTL